MYRTFLKIEPKNGYLCVIRKTIITEISVMQVSSINILLPTLGLALLLAVAWASLSVLRLRTDSSKRRQEREGALQFELAALTNASARAREAKVSALLPQVESPWEATIPAKL